MVYKLNIYDEKFATSVSLSPVCWYLVTIADGNFFICYPDFLRPEFVDSFVHRDPQILFASTAG